MDHSKNATKLAVVGGLIMILLGFLAVLLPSTVNVRLSDLIGWIIVAGGIAYFAYALSAGTDNEVLCRMLIGFFYIFAGFYLLASRQIEMRPLAYLVAGIVLAEGLLEFVIFSQVRQQRGSQWILFDAIATLVLSLVIWRSSLASSQQGLGVLIGIKFIISGFTRVMYSLAAIKNRKAIA